MDATRTRLGFAADWLAAGALLLGTVVVAVLVVRELRIARGSPGAGAGVDAAGSAVAGSAAAVPAEAVSVPVLTLGTSEIKVGDLMSAAVPRLTAVAPALQQVRRSIERGPIGLREIRWYQLSGTSFIVVFEPFERRGEPRIAAIYLI